MRTLVGAVLGLIAVGVWLIAYGVLSPRASATAPAWNGMPVATDSRGNIYQLAHPLLGSDRVEGNAAMAPLQLRCEPAQRAIIRQVAGVAEAECADASSIDRDGSMRTPVAYQTSERRLMRVYESDPAPRRTTTGHVGRRSGRDWQKTALVIGGTTAAGAGLGAIFGGKTGALIGAALGGGASSIYEARKR